MHARFSSRKTYVKITKHGQAELLVHAVENASALEILTIDTANRNGNRLPQNVERLGAYIARSCLEGKISPKTKLHILHQE